jgi:hypothetical protein
VILKVCFKRYLDDGQVEDSAWNIEKTLIRTIQSSAKLWFEGNLKGQDNTVTTQEQGTLNYIDLVEKVCTEFEKAVCVVDPFFLR